MIDYFKSGVNQAANKVTKIINDLNQSLVKPSSVTLMT